MHPKSDQRIQQKKQEQKQEQNIIPDITGVMSTN